MYNGLATGMIPHDTIFPTTSILCILLTPFFNYYYYDDDLRLRMDGIDLRLCKIASFLFLWQELSDMRPIQLHGISPTQLHSMVPTLLQFHSMSSSHLHENRLPR